MVLATSNTHEVWSLHRSASTELAKPGFNEQLVSVVLFWVAPVHLSEAKRPWKADLIRILNPAGQRIDRDPSSHTIRESTDLAVVIVARVESQTETHEWIPDD